MPAEQVEQCYRPGVGGDHRGHPCTACHRRQRHGADDGGLRRVGATHRVPQRGQVNAGEGTDDQLAGTERDPVEGLVELVGTHGDDHRVRGLSDLCVGCRDAHRVESGGQVGGPCRTSRGEHDAAGSTGILAEQSGDHRLGDLPDADDADDAGGHFPSLGHFSASCMIIWITLDAWIWSSSSMSGAPSDRSSSWEMMSPSAPAMR